MLKITKIQFFRILILYTLLALSAVCCYNIEKLLAPAKKRPFQCNDESLRKPFVSNTVSSQQLYTLGIYFPLTLIAVTELISNLAKRKSLSNSMWQLQHVLESVFVLSLFLAGLTFERLYKSVAKVKMARLRPNFLTVCKPVNVDGYTCQGLDDTTLMDDYKCSSDSYLINSSFTSFPSGHTSLISYSMVFLISYLYIVTLKLKHFKSLTTLLILIIQTFCFFIIIFVAISRIFDYRHHWSDVCAGFIFGSSIALVLNYYLLCQLENIEKWFKFKDAATAKTGLVNTNIKEHEEAYAMEVVAE